MSVLEAKNRLEGTTLKDLPVADGQDLVYDGEVHFQNTEADGAAGDTWSYAFKARCDMEIVAVDICPGAALTANDTNNAVLTLGKADGAGGGSTAILALTTNLASGNWVTDVFKSMGTPVAAAKRVAKGQIVTLKKTIGGTGVVVPVAGFTVRYRKV